MAHRAAAVVAVALVVAACGSDDDTADDTAGTEISAPSTSSSEGTETTAGDEPGAGEDSTTLATTGTTERPAPTAPDTSAPTTGDTAGGPDDSEEPTVGTGPIDAGLQPFIDQAVADLAEDLSIPVSDVTVQSARLVQWSDASAGCPEPGMQYAQVITDGSAIELEAGDGTYWYHTGGPFTVPTRCDSPLRQPPPEDGTS